MEHIIQFFKDKKIVAINLTALVTTIDSLKKYYKQKRPNVILYILRNDRNEKLFEYMGAPDDHTCCLVHKNKGIAVNINQFDDQFKSKLEKFISEELECNICYNKESMYISCENCGCNVCFTCIDKIKNVACPECNTKIEIKTKRICWVCRKYNMDMYNCKACRLKICINCVDIHCLPTMVSIENTGMEIEFKQCPRCDEVIITGNEIDVDYYTKYHKIRPG